MNTRDGDVLYAQKERIRHWRCVYVRARSDPAVTMAGSWELGEPGFNPWTVNNQLRSTDTLWRAHLWVFIIFRLSDSFFFLLAISDADLPFTLAEKKRSFCFVLCFSSNSYLFFLSFSHWLSRLAIKPFAQVNSFGTDWALELLWAGQTGLDAWGRINTAIMPSPSIESLAQQQTWLLPAYNVFK